ncbi:uncharacterized protein LOC103317374 [Nasonia vitripennis]|uniref:SWIM-type domain-containing protein n=1 Tax=Nasonia vitripennis TaxID=7425 RepID=A0A7M7M2M6_NASVI|nr:uncharacterized protein LOC103317374 [Nasonia vitripennis]
MISMKNICDYAGTNPKQRKFIEGERVYKAKFIIKCGKTAVSEDSGTTSISAVCLQTTAVKDKSPHEINGEISRNGDILHFKCTCKVGLGEKCKHIVATFLYIYQKGDDLEVLSCTDKKCGWKQDHSKVLEEYDAAPLMQHSCFAEPAVKTKKIVNASSIKRCLEPEQYEVIAENELGEIETLQSNQSSSGSQDQAVVVKKKRKPVPEVEVSESQLSEIACIIRNQLPMSALAKHEKTRSNCFERKKQSQPS